MRPWDWLCLYREWRQSRPILTHKLCHISNFIQLEIWGSQVTWGTCCLFPVDNLASERQVHSRYMFIHRWDLSGSILQSITKIIIAARHSMLEHMSGCPKFGTQTHLQHQGAGRLGTWVRSAELRKELLMELTTLSSPEWLRLKISDEDEDDGNDEDKLEASALLWTWSILVVGGGCIGKRARQSCITYYSALHKSEMHMSLVALLHSALRM